MELFNFNKLKRPQLIELAGKVDIKGRHRMRKRDLVQELRKYLPMLQEELGRLRPAVRKDVPAATGSSLSAKKSEAAPARPAGTPYVDRGMPLPQGYGRDRLVMLVRDPYWVYCYWELEGPACRRAEESAGKNIFDGARWVLRVHFNGGEAQDVDVRPDTRNWYINVRDNCEMHSEIGVITRSGKFVSLAKSNRVQTPRSGMSDEMGTEWMTVEEGFASIRRHVSHTVSIQTGAKELLSERFGVKGLSSLFFGASERASRIPPK